MTLIEARTYLHRGRTGMVNHEYVTGRIEVNVRDV